ncbi:MAG: hypothetical protein JWN48_2997, partial [Myxococcaceae bacterium]|nr:hypothetical protein [Myxococcaceae bacterium]
MTRTRLTLLALSCMLGCTRREPAEQPAPMPLPAPTHYLDETFALGSAHCRLVAAEPMLTEPAHPGEGLVADDIPVVETRFACEDARGAAIPIRSLHAELAWLDQARALHPPSSASKLAQREPSHVVFELGRGTEGLMSARSYDARTGEPVGPHALGRARLIIEASAETLASRDPSAHAPRARVVLAPWPRLHDPALDALLDRLALGLATAAPFDMLSHTEQGRAALVLVSDLYGQTVERF